MIVINKQSCEINRFSINSKHDFFNCEELIISIKKDRLIIRKPKLSDIKRCKVTFFNNKMKCITVMSSKLNVGVFKIDEEDSNEDELVVYFDNDNTL
jgi:hypothetical protein